MTRNFDHEYRATKNGSNTKWYQNAHEAREEANKRGWEDFNIERREVDDFWHRLE